MSIPSQPRAVVTGAGSGLGRALCLELARRGARVLASDVDEASARATAALVQQRGAVALALRCDVTRPEQLEALACAADEAWGGVDLVVNNAGTGASGAVGDIALDDWRRVVDVNLWGVIHGCHAFVPRLRRQGAGHVLNIGSAAGLLTLPYSAPYCATKAAVVALSESLHAELRPQGVGVTVACPTYFRSNIAQASTYTDTRTRQAVERLMDAASLTAEDVARACLAAVERDVLYALPMADGRWMWRFKRLVPAGFARAVPTLQRLMGLEPPAAPAPQARDEDKGEAA